MYSPVSKREFDDTDIRCWAEGEIEYLHSEEIPELLKCLAQIVVEDILDAPVQVDK